MLRVIAGKAKGRKLKSVPGDTTRPVTDMVKEALFNILGGDVIESNWWDLFGGTGAIGIEALSRGAAFIRFSDLNRLPVETIKENLAACGFSKQAEVKRGDSLAMLRASPTGSLNTSTSRRPNTKKSGRRPSNCSMKTPAGWPKLAKPLSRFTRANTKTCN